MTPALDRICRSTETAEPPKEAHPEHVKGNDPNPSQHGAHGTSRDGRYVANTPDSTLAHAPGNRTRIGGVLAKIVVDPTDKTSGISCPHGITGSVQAYVAGNTASGNFPVVNGQTWYEGVAGGTEASGRSSNQRLLQLNSVCEQSRQIPACPK